MKLDQVAVQLYTVRDYLKTPEDVAKSLRKIRGIGYRAVELAGLCPIGNRELKAMLDGEGLACFSSHEGGEQLFKHTDQVVEKLTALGCGSAVYPYPNLATDTAAEVDSLIAQLDRAGKLLAEAKISLLYHNHNMEFRRFGGRLMLDMIYDGIDGRNLGAELDTYWVQAGGQSPERWCARLKGRLSILHMKDFGVEDRYEGVPRSVYKEVGLGNLDWTGIVKAAEKAGCRRFVVEQDGNWIDNDPFKSLKASYDFLEGKLCK